jgi:hypothetical protein
MTVWAALIQAFGAVAAAAVAVTLWHLKTQAERADEDRRRDSRVADIVRAVRADIAVELTALRSQFSEPSAAMLREKALQQLRLTAPPDNAKDMPQASSAPPSFVFEAIKADLTILPADLIGSVVAYYRHDQRLTALAMDFSSGRYSGISDERQAEAVTGFFRIGALTLDAALQAAEACDRHLAAIPAVRRK